MPQVLPSVYLFLLIGAVGAWVTPASAKTLQIGVPGHSPYPKFLSVKCNDTKNETCFSGHSIDIFKLVWKNLNINDKDYEFLPYKGHTDDLMLEVFNKTFDLVVGDISIVAKRCKYVEFSRPYTELGSRLVVLEKQQEGRAWIFVKPFTATLWGVTGIVFLYNGLIVWLMETFDAAEQHSSNVGHLIWLTCTTLFPIHGDKLHCNLSKMVMVVWLFVALVLTQSYTASLTSMLTVRRLRPSVVNMESLLKSKAKVGCDKGSFMSNYLETVVGFDASRIETFNLDEYAEALSNGTIQAAFIESPSIQLFFDENPKGFTVTGRAYEIGGYGFVFQKGSDLVEKFSDELLGLRENGTLRDLENDLLSRKGWTKDTDEDNHERLSLDAFLGLFLITGGTSTLVFVLFLVSRIGKKYKGRNYPESPIRRAEDGDDFQVPQLPRP